MQIKIIFIILKFVGKIQVFNPAYRLTRSKLWLRKKEHVSLLAKLRKEQKDVQLHVVLKKEQLDKLI